MRRFRMYHAVMVLVLLVGSMFVLSGCGGGGGGGTAAMPGAGNSISGSAVKGPVSGATVTAYGIQNGMAGAALASCTTDSRGNFRMSVGDNAGPFMLEMSGGTYIDEATGSPMSMSPGDVMTAVVPSVASSETVTDIQVTPLTSMAQMMAANMAGGMTPENITAANASVGGYFMVGDILHTMPMNPLVSGSSGTATQDMKNYGMSIAAISQSAKDMGMTSSSSMVTALMQDASDGVMNGMMGTSPVMMGGMMGMTSRMTTTAGTIGLADEMAAFIGSGRNLSGVTAGDMQALMDQLSAAGGQVQSGGGMPMNGMVSGTAFNGRVGGAAVMAYAVSTGAMGPQLSSAVTDSSGNFSLSLGAYTGPVMLRMTGGSYQDLATGATASMMTGDVMTAVMPSISSGATVTGVQITPLTSMAQARAQAMTNGMTDANISAANTGVGGYFMVSDILHTVPMNAALSGSGGAATTDMQNYGAAVAAMSQYAQSIGMTDPEMLITALMQDASDGVMNGMMGGTQITLGGMGGGMMGGGSNMMQANAGTTGLADAMTTFLGGSENQSGLTSTDMSSLITKLQTTGGQLQ